MAAASDKTRRVESNVKAAAARNTRSSVAGSSDAHCGLRSAAASSVPALPLPPSAIAAASPPPRVVSVMTAVHALRSAGAKARRTAAAAKIPTMAPTVAAGVLARTPTPTPPTPSAHAIFSSAERATASTPTASPNPRRSASSAPMPGVTRSAGLAGAPPPKPTPTASDLATPTISQSTSARAPGSRAAAAVSSAARVSPAFHALATTHTKSRRSRSTPITASCSRRPRPPAGGALCGSVGSARTLFRP